MYLETVTAAFVEGIDSFVKAAKVYAGSNVLSSKGLWQNHLNYMTHMCLASSLKLLIAAHASQITPVVCRVSSGNPESST
jgi:hypothetical protein